MPLRSAMELIHHAQAEGYAVGYFESWNIESLQGVLDAAEKTQSPILIGVNGEFLSKGTRLTPEDLTWHAALYRSAAESAAVPCAMIFNECSNDNWIRQAANLGFSLVMPDDPQANPEAFVHRVTELVHYAHAMGTAVEAEFGHLPCGVSGTLGEGEAEFTDPDAAARFVQSTGIDLLAVSVGNVHILLEGKRSLDVDRLAAIRNKVAVPFDLHGGSGIDADSLREAISLGVAKVCYGTYVKQRYIDTVQRLLSVEETNPHMRLGCGGPEDVMVAGRLAVRDAVLERIETLGCCGRV
jgi:ketose-bisphosphate aldolase